MIRLTGTLRATTPDDAQVIETYLPDHIRLSRAEPGCLHFEVTRTADPWVWLLDEGYTDQTAFKAHQTRNQASLWWAKSQGLIRDFDLADES